MNSKLKDVIYDYQLQFAALEKDLAIVYEARAILDFRSAPDTIVDALIEQEKNMFKQRDLLETFIDDLVELSVREDSEIASIMNLLRVDKN